MLEVPTVDMQYGFTGLPGAEIRGMANFDDIWTLSQSHHFGQT